MNRESAVARAIGRLAEGASLAPMPGGVFGVFPRGDRRRRPFAKLPAAMVRRLEAEGVLTRWHSEVFTLSAAGLRRAVRETAPEGEGFIAQHQSLEHRAVVDPDGDIRTVRGADPSAALRRLAQLRDGEGKPWLDQRELTAAEVLRRDWEIAQQGLAGGMDLTAAPLGGRGQRAGNAKERAMAARCDARRRVADAMARLAPQLRRVVERICIHEEGLEALERAERWPARSAKLALKLGLSQLAMDLA